MNTILLLAQISTNTSPDVATSAAFLLHALCPSIDFKSAVSVVAALFFAARILRKALPDKLQTGNFGLALKHTALEIDPPSVVQAKASQTVGTMFTKLMVFGFILGLAFRGMAQENMVTNPIPNNPFNDQTGTLAGIFTGNNSTNGVFKNLYKGAGDALSYIEGNTNGFARVSLEGYYLMTKHSGNGGGADFYIPLSGTNNILGAGFGIAYLNHDWYDATLNAKLGDFIPLPMGLSKFFPVYAYVESGGGYNFGTQAAIAQAFTGASLHYSLFRTKAGNTFDFTGGYAVGTISDITGNVQAAGGSFTWSW